MDFIKKEPADWTPENIEAFWNWQSQYHPAKNNYFTAHLSVGIVRFLKNKGLVKGKLLDYGCGSGHLLEQLGKMRHTECYGIDFSPASVKETLRRTNKFPNIKKVILAEQIPLPFDNNCFDTITFIETIEHLSDDMLCNTIAELFRVLKKGGKIFITTPFNEDLSAHLAFCPFCRSAFHHVQHMQTFTVERMNAIFRENGFTIISCRAMDMQLYKLGWLKYSIKRLLIKAAEITGLKEPVTNKCPNLVTIVSKA